MLPVEIMQNELPEDEIRYQLLDSKKQFEMLDKVRSENINTLKSESLVEIDKKLIELQIKCEMFEYMLSSKFQEAKDKRQDMFEEQASSEDRKISLVDLKQLIENSLSINIENYYNQGNTNMSENTGDKINQTITGRNNQTTQINKSTFNDSQVFADKQIAPTEVAKLLAQLEEKIKNLTALSETDREKSVKRIEAAKVEVQESDPDKESIAKSLKRVGETLSEAGETTKEVKELFNELFPTVKKIAEYLGYAVGTIWGMF